MRRGRIFALIRGFAPLLAVACAQGPDIWVPREVDFQPPRLLACELGSDGSLEVRFDEVVDRLEVVLPQGEATVETEDKKTFRIRLGVQPPIGREWVIKLAASDPSGNGSEVLVPIYGINPRLPALRLNEVNIQGSSTRPDYIELLVLQDGNLAGLVVALGSPSDGEPFYVFPSVEVKRGDYVTLHAKPSGKPGEKDETRHKREATAPLSCANAWDFWWKGGKGLSGTTGGIVLMDNPRGRVLDALLYTNRTSASDDRYGGWGSRLNQQRAQWIHRQGVWPVAGEKIVPEDAVDSSYVTSTRTLNRRPNKEGKEAWFTGASGTATPGGPNTTQVHQP